MSTLWYCLLALSALAYVECQTPTLSVFNGTDSATYTFLTSGTVFYTLPNQQQLPFVKSTGIELTITQASSQFVDSSTNTTYQCTYAICAQSLIRSSLDPFSWPYGGCTNVGNHTSVYGNIAAPGYTGLPPLNQAISVQARPGPFHMSIAVQSTAPVGVNPASAGCTFAFTINIPSSNVCPVGLWGDNCQPLNTAITTPSIQPTVNLVGTTVNSSVPYLLGVNLDSTFLSAATISTTTASSTDNITVTGRAGTAPTSTVSAFSVTSINLPGQSALTSGVFINNPVYRSRFASPLEQYAYILSVQPAGSAATAALSNVTVGEIACPQQDGFGPSCAYGPLTGFSYSLDYGTFAHFVLGSNGFYNGLFVVTIDFQNTVGQTNFSFGLVPIGQNAAQMFIRKGGVPSATEYDAYVNSTTAPGSGVVYYESGNTTLDGTTWYIGIGYQDVAQVVVQDRSAELSSAYSADEQSTHHTASVQSTVRTRVSHHEQRRTRGRITAFQSRSGAEQSSAHQFATQDWTTGGVVAFFAGANCINNCSYALNGGNGICTSAHNCQCLNGWASPDCSLFNPPNPHTLSQVEVIVLPIVACIGSVALGVLICVLLRRRRYRGYTGLENGVAPGFGGTGYALGSGEAVQGSRSARPTTATRPAAPSTAAPANTQTRSNIQTGASTAGGTSRQSGTRLGSRANVHGFG